jgi:hypothetical protein
MFSSRVVILARLCSVFVWWLLATHFILLFPLHFPSCAQTCAITQYAGPNGVRVYLPLHIFDEFLDPLRSSAKKKPGTRPEALSTDTSRRVYNTHIKNDGHSVYQNLTDKTNNSVLQRRHMSKALDQAITWLKQDTQWTYNVTFRRVHATIVVVEKQWVLHVLSVFVALGILHAMRMRHIVICGLPGSTIFFHIIS